MIGDHLHVTHLNGVAIRRAGASAGGTAGTASRRAGHLNFVSNMLSQFAGIARDGVGGASGVLNQSVAPVRTLQTALNAVLTAG